MKGSFKVRTITDRPDMKVSASSNDASVHLHIFTTHYVWNPDTNIYELRTITCADAPPDALVVLAGKGSADVGAEKKTADPVLTAAAAFAFSSSGAQLQRAANQRRTDSFHESGCNMYAAGAISGREYQAQEILNTKVALVMAGQEAIVSLLAPPPPSGTITADAPASAGSAPQPARITIGTETSDETTDRSGSGQDKPAPSGTVPTLPVAAKVATTAAGAAKSKTTPKPKTQASTGGAGSAKGAAPAPGQNLGGTPKQDPEVLKVAIAAIVKLTEEGLAENVSDVACLLDASHGTLTAEQWRTSCGGNAAIVAVDADDVQPLVQTPQPIFRGERLFTQLGSTAQVDTGRDLVQALGKKFGPDMSVYTVEVRPQNLQNVEIRYYGRTTDEDHSDHDYKAADELRNELSSVFSPDTIKVINWHCCVAKLPSCGLLELWIPAHVTIDPGALAQGHAAPPAAVPPKIKKPKRATPGA